MKAIKIKDQRTNAPAFAVYVTIWSESQTVNKPNIAKNIGENGNEN